ncbi:Josephin family protein [Brugia pahangi]
MDGTTAPYKEDLSKAQRYSDAVRQHDLRIRRHNLNTTAEDDLCLLFDIGQRAIEVLQRPSSNFTAHSDLREFARNMSNAMQEASLCAQHAVNMLLQGSYFTAVDLAEIASEIDSREGRVLNEQDAKSHNVDDSGFFSLQVIAEALKVFNLELIPLNNPRAATYRDDPTLGRAYICNLNEHWFAVRRLGFQWFTLNSLLPTPRLISDTYLSLFFAQLINDGYSIFVVEGVLPLCTADEQLSQFPVDPALAGMSDLNPVAKTEAISNDQAKDDEDLRLAMEMSRQMVKDDSALKTAVSNSLADAHNKNNLNESDEELQERLLQKAIQMSLESFGMESSQATSSTAENNKLSASIKNSKQNSSQIPQSEEIRRKREHFLKKFEK